MDSSYILYDREPLFDPADKIIKHLALVQANPEKLADILQHLPRSKWRKLYTLEHTSESAVELNTQLVIMHPTKCLERKGLNPEEKSHKSFLKFADPNSTEDAHLRDRDTNELGSEDSSLHKEYRESEIKYFVVQDMQLTEHGEIVDIEARNARFSWQGFVILGLDCIRSRNLEITALLQTSGGVNESALTLQRQVDDPEDSPQIPCRTPSIERGALVESDSKGTAQRTFIVTLPSYASLWPDVAEFNRRVFGAKSNGGDAPEKPSLIAPQLASHNGRSCGWLPLNVEQDMCDAEPCPPTTSLTTSDRLSQVKLYLEREKENLQPRQAPSLPAAPRFIDPQPHAQRVPWSQETWLSSTTGPSASQIARGKRTLPVGDEDFGVLGEGEGFEQEKRIVSEQGKRKNSPTSSRRSVSPKRARFRKQPQLAKEGLNSEEEDKSDTLENKLPSSNYGEINQISKKLSRLNSPKRQNRTKWSQLEIDQLISLIQEVGCSWARIKNLDKERGNVLELRDQVALKDKARNMKNDFIKAGVQLPNNFEGVTLSTSQKAKLKELGIQGV